MPNLKCKMCGAELQIENLDKNTLLATCDYCGAKQTIPSVDSEKKLTLFNRAINLLHKCEFDKASVIYESIVADFPEEAEAYWGLVLCRFGIEYVDDPKTAAKIPTCHRSSFDSVMDDPNFEQACEYADVNRRALYREEAKQIEELRNVSSVKTVVIGKGVTKIGDSAFCYCTSLTSVTIPDSVTKIGERAFKNCSGLTSITIPDSVTEIGGYAFHGCSGLTNFIIPDRVTSIGEYAFKSSSITSMTIGSSVTKIGDYAFDWCTSLTSVIIPKSVTEIGVYAFDYCSKLATVYYRGTEEEWSKISIGGSNYSLNNAEIVYNY